VEQDLGAARAPEIVDGQRETLDGSAADTIRTYYIGS
jgi:hypothetical protein